MRGTLLLLAAPGDGGAAAVARALSARGGHGGVLTLTPADLARARWSHRVNGGGEASTRITLPTGQVLDDRTIGAVLHRLPGLPLTPGAENGPRAKDALYTHSERQALVASWLLSLAPRVIGLISAYGTAYGTLSRTTALVHAEQCGLPVARRGGATRGGLVGLPAPGERHVPRLAWPGGPGAPVPVDVLPEAPAAYHDSLLIAGDRVIGPRAGDYGERCHRLAGALGTRHFELRFAPRPTGAVVTDVHLCPRLDDPLHVEATASFMVAVAGQPTRRPE
ncbi:hypothetical protein OG889_09125 [Streptomyces sp. NBC_00481]|uniref:hypothetical protein n=1 Tax=unclassified Streptomyces TaxID=2593676 RepID=UPI002DD8F366|nr:MULTISPECIES: hypothetical protein [unclassified Streptomyces]WRY94865.1 hypothetical protein OG889_09125 [Streptomyces sp. NBC_00481]